MGAMGGWFGGLGVWGFRVFRGLGVWGSFPQMGFASASKAPDHGRDLGLSSAIRLEPVARLIPIGGIHFHLVKTPGKNEQVFPVIIDYL